MHPNIRKNILCIVALITTLWGGVHYSFLINSICCLSWIWLASYAWRTDRYHWFTILALCGIFYNPIGLPSIFFLDYFILALPIRAVASIIALVAIFKIKLEDPVRSKWV